MIRFVENRACYFTVYSDYIIYPRLITVLAEEQISRQYACLSKIASSINKEPILKKKKHARFAEEKLYETGGQLPSKSEFSFIFVSLSAKTRPIANRGDSQREPLKKILNIMLEGPLRHFSKRNLCIYLLRSGIGERNIMSRLNIWVGFKKGGQIFSFPLLRKFYVRTDII